MTETNFWSNSAKTEIKRMFKLTLSVLKTNLSLISYFNQS